MSLLVLEGVSRRFGGILAVDRVDLAIDRGELHALIGPNGAGKSTLVGLIAGRIRPDAGTIALAGEDITRLPAPARVRRGIGYTFQVTSVFAGMSVFDNVALAAQGGRGRAAARGGGLAVAVGEALERVGLASLAGDEAGTLSHGHQRLLELAMGLALCPQLLILDEPAQGLAPDEVAMLGSLLGSLVPAVTLLLIEHDMDLVMALASRVSVLESGRLVAQGSPAEIRADPAVQRAYLGD